jgi:hypothetical protein
VDALKVWNAAGLGRAETHNDNDIQRSEQS